MTKRNKFVVGFLAVLLLATIGVVAAFWASMVYVSLPEEQDLKINIADAPEIYTTVNIGDLMEVNEYLLPINATTDDNSGPTEDGVEVKYVMVPVTITWTFAPAQLNQSLTNINGLEGIFDLQIATEVKGSNDTVLPDEAEYVRVLFFEEEPDVDEALDGDWTDVDSFIALLGTPVEAGGELTLLFGVDNAVTWFMVVFIEPVPNLTVANAIADGSIEITISLALDPNQGLNDGFIDVTPNN